MELAFLSNTNRISRYLIIPLLVGAVVIGSYFASKSTNIDSRPTKTEIIREWQDYAPVLNKALEGMLEDNALFAVHPGFVVYAGNIKAHSKYGYESYLKNIKNKIAETISDGRNVVLYIPEYHKKETLDIIGFDGEPLLILVPTYDSVNEIVDIPPYMGISREEFHKKISKKVKSGVICGEFEQKCVASVENGLKDAGINLRRIEDCIY